MKIEHISVSKFNPDELVKEINKRTAGRNMHGIFYKPTSLLKGVLEIYTTDIRTVEVEVPCKPGKIKSEYIGVHRELPTHRWRASITVNGKRLSLGRFNTEEEAAKAYDEVALKYRGSKAKLNFPIKLEIGDFLEFLPDSGNLYTKGEVYKIPDTNKMGFPCELTTDFDDQKCYWTEEGIKKKFKLFKKGNEQ